MDNPTQLTDIPPCPVCKSKVYVQCDKCNTFICRVCEEKGEPYEYYITIDGRYNTCHNPLCSENKENYFDM